MIYRATKSTETSIPLYSCWSEDRDVAVAYQQNPGFGGEHLRELDLEPENVLDITGGLEELAEALGYEDPHETAADWRGSCWLYPWEESRTVRERLDASGYEWIRYVDDYPEGAITLVRIR